MPAGEKEIEVSVSGKVQGVNYRTFVKETAGELGIRGYVRNVSDGSVEVVAQGEESELQSLIEQLWKGPFFASVDDVDATWHDTPQDAFTDFTVADSI